MVKYIGNYNVEDIGVSYDKDVKYKIIRLTKFDSNDKQIDDKIYYCQNLECFSLINAISIIEQIMRLPNYSVIDFNIAVTIVN